MSYKYKVHLPDEQIEYNDLDQAVRMSHEEARNYPGKSITVVDSITGEVIAESHAEFDVYTVNRGNLS